MKKEVNSLPTSICNSSMVVDQEESFENTNNITI